MEEPTAGIAPHLGAPSRMRESTAHPIPPSSTNDPRLASNVQSVAQAPTAPFTQTVSVAPHEWNTWQSRKAFSEHLAFVRAIVEVAPSDAVERHLATTAPPDFEARRDRLLAFMSTSVRADDAKRAWIITRYFTDGSCSKPMLSRETADMPSKVKAWVEGSEYYQTLQAQSGGLHASHQYLRTLIGRSVHRRIGAPVRNFVHGSSIDLDAARILSDRIDLTIGEAVTHTRQQAAISPHASYSTMLSSFAPLQIRIASQTARRERAVQTEKMAVIVAWDRYRHVLEATLHHPLPESANHFEPDVDNFIRSCVIQAETAWREAGRDTHAVSPEEAALEMFTDTQYVLDPHASATSIAKRLTWENGRVGISDGTVQWLLSRGPNYRRLVDHGRYGRSDIAQRREAAYWEAMWSLQAAGPHVKCPAHIAGRIFRACEKVFGTSGDSPYPPPERDGPSASTSQTQ